MKYKKRTWDSLENKWENITVETVKDYGLSATDTSHWRPNVSTIDLLGAKTTMLPKECYEFPDGKDTGERNYVIRSLGADRVEVDNAIEKLRQKTNENGKEIMKEYETYSGMTFTNDNE